MSDPREVLAGRIRQEIKFIDERRQKLVHALEVIENLDLTGPSGGVDPRILSAGGEDLGRNGGDPLERNDLSLREAAEIVIRQEKRPLSVPEIAERLLDSSFEYEKDEKTLRRSLSGVLGRWVRKGEEFFRPDTGKYAPLEWRGQDEQLSIDE